MIKIDLVTGFLGSGKTTFIKNYVKYLLDKGLKVGLLENDYGAINVDMLLLNELRCDRLEIEMVSGGCDNDCHRRRFKTKLIAMGMSGYDRIVVEPSGIYDVDEFFDVLYEEPLNRWYERGSVIAVVDCNLELNLSDSSKYCLMTQVADSGIIVFSKSDVFKYNTANCDHSFRPEKRVLNYIADCFSEYNCDRKLENEYLCKSYKSFTDEDYELITNCGHHSSSHIKINVDNESCYKSVNYMDLKIDEDRIVSIIDRIFNDEKCGNVIRVKGCIRTSDDEWLMINAVKEMMDTSIVINGQEVLIVIGEELNKERIDEIIQS